MMSAVIFLLEVLKLTFAGLLVVFVTYLIMRPYLRLLVDLAHRSPQATSLPITLPLRLQAYERLVLLIERLNPVNLMLRVPPGDLDIHSYQQVLVNEIKSEFLHNVTQQIYVDQISWNVILKLRNDTIALINNAAQVSEPDINTTDFRKKIIRHIASLEADPYLQGAEIIRREISAFL